MKTNEFDSAYCNVKYIPEDNVVLLAWKQPSYFDNYRAPSLAMLHMLQENKDSNYVCDARHGFEDEKDDVVWGFSYLLPEMAKTTTCKHVVFIMNMENEIEEEMDMWGNEFRKYFKVARVATYGEAIDYLKKEQNK